MADSRTRSGKRDTSALRKRAEKILQTRPADLPTLPTVDVQTLVHELSVHQMELEIQNDELREAQLELAKSRDNYSDLYDFAPVGYVTLDKDGLVVEANLTAANMLEVERKSLVGAGLSRWIHRDSQDAFYLHRQAAFLGKPRQVCELVFLKANEETFTARVECMLVTTEGGSQCRTALIDVTEQKKAEIKIHDLNEALHLRVAEQTGELKKLAMTMAHLSEGVMITSDHNWLESQILNVNPAMCRITGYTADELRSLNPRQLYGELTDPAVLRHVQADLAGQRSHACELIVYRKDGTPFIAEVFFRPIIDLAGSRTSFIAIHRDVTERKRIEEKLRQEHELSENIINTAPNIVLLLDSEGRIIRFNPFMEQLSGWSVAEACGLDWFDTFLPERDRIEIRQRFLGSLQGQRACGWSNPILTRNGGERQIEWYDAPLTDISGELIGLLCTGLDVTERKRAAEAVYEREQRMLAILNTAADAIITIDKQGIIDMVNPATERMFGYSQRELIGRNINILMPSPYSEEHDGYLARYLATGQARIIGIGREVTGKRKDGSTFPIDLAVSEVDHIGLFTGIIRDISERKEAQRLLMESERLAAIGEAMAGLAHESRNALQRGQACLDLLTAELEDQPDSIELIKSVQRANDDLFRLYEEVRAYAAPINIRPKTHDVRPIIQQAWDDLAIARNSRDIRLDEVASDENLTVDLDPFSMTQVFRNILDNAIQVCLDPVVIRVEYRNVEFAGRPALSVSIRDNGPGLSPDLADRVFDTFYTTRSDGTGLGLAIAQRIVTAHGGRITVNPDCRVGAEFVVTLPITFLRNVNQVV